MVVRVRVPLAALQITPYFFTPYPVSMLYGQTFLANTTIARNGKTFNKTKKKHIFGRVTN